MAISSFEIPNSTHLQAADDAVLSSVLEHFIKPHVVGLDFPDGMPLASRVYELAMVSREETTSGTCLPLYMPTGEVIEGSPSMSLIPVWAGERLSVDVGDRKIEMALFDGHDIDLVPLIKKDDLFRLNAGFRTALLTHYVRHIAIMPEDPRLSSEAFVLGVFDELYPDDAHYAATGIPSTCAASIRRQTRPATSDELNSHPCGGRIENGWSIRLRDTMPPHKEFNELYRATRELDINMVDYPSIEGGSFKAPTRESISKPKKSRHGRDSTATMYSFVNNWARSHGRIVWDEVLAAFEDKYPQYRYWSIRDVEVNPAKEGGYRDSKALKASYYGKKQREEQKSKRNEQRDDEARG